MVGLLAALSASAAGGMRIALPLLLIALLRIDKLWSEIPLLSGVHPQVAIAILVSWSLLELFASKTFVGLRVLQPVVQGCSPALAPVAAISAAVVAAPFSVAAAHFARTPVPSLSYFSNAYLGVLQSCTTLLWW